jgi:hypothetical protein
MTRKLGKRVKRFTQSLIELDHPKTLGSAPPANAVLPDISQARLSLVTIKAERHKVNINANTRDQIRGNAKLGINSVATIATGSTISKRLSRSGTRDLRARRNSVSGQKECAGVLVVVDERILKRSCFVLFRLTLL